MINTVHCNDTSPRSYYPKHNGCSFWGYGHGGGIAMGNSEGDGSNTVSEYALRTNVRLDGRSYDENEPPGSIWRYR